MTKNGGRKGAPRIPLPIIILAGILVVVAGYRLLGVSPARASEHPDPRPGVTAEGVVPAARYAAYPRVATVYGMAAEVPEVLDGLYCHCDCSKHSGHRSLLTCFETDHGAGCDVCLGEATLAYRMSRSGASLDEIRDVIDRTFGR